MKNKIKIAGVILILAVISAILQFSTPNVADPDAFYHITHAQIYRERGIFYSDFPWAQYSVIKDLKADIWYGFHLFLVPFTYIQNGILSIKIAGVFITFLTLLAFYWVLGRLKLKWPFLWTLIFAVASPDVMYRLTMTRPHNLSLALGLIIFSLLLTKDQPILLVVASALNAFLHLALGWLPILIALASNLTLKIRREKVRWKNIIYVILGSALGLLARPHPWGALKLVYIQVVKITFIKLQKIPLSFGRELKPPDLNSFIRNTLPIFIVLALALGIYKYQTKKQTAESKNQKSILASAMVLFIISLAITTLVARRSYDIFTAFGIVAAASALTLAAPNISKNNLAISGLILIISLLNLNSLNLFIKYNRDAWSPAYLKESSLWLKNNSQPGEIVFHTSWDQFGALFFWNQKNYYINGMDPVFMYAYNPSLYWKNHFMFTTDAAYNQTCGKIKCTAGEVEDTAKVLAEDFKASYVVLRKAQNPRTYFFWLKDKTFLLVFENEKEAVFKIPSL